MIALFTDFGTIDPYVGQMHAVLAARAPNVPVIDLFHHVPEFDIRAGAYLLPAYASEFPVGTVFVCVVDPGVGGERRPLMLQADGNWYVGPDNGLFHMLQRRASAVQCYEILWRPERLSTSFHGRDLFAPVAARLAQSEMPRYRMAEPAPVAQPWPDDLEQILYIDHYGNAITGVRAQQVSSQAMIKINNHELNFAPVFDAVPQGKPFWYANANGLVEIAANQERADKILDLRLGDAFTIED